MGHRDGRWPRWGWVLSAIALIVVASPAFVVTRVECFDYVDAPGACTAGPPLGIAGTIVLGIVIAGAAGYAIYRGFRRPDGLPTPSSQ